MHGLWEMIVGIRGVFSRWEPGHEPADVERLSEGPRTEDRLSSDILFDQMNWLKI